MRFLFMERAPRPRAAGRVVSDQGSDDQGNARAEHGAEHEGEVGGELGHDAIEAGHDVTRGACASTISRTSRVGRLGA